MNAQNPLTYICSFSEPLTLPALVLPSRPSIPVCPLEVANTAGSTVAVLCLFVRAVVENVCSAAPAVSVKDDGYRNTSATAGAGTRIVQIWFVQPAFSMDSDPAGRPSDCINDPNVCPAHVKSPFCETLLADKYLVGWRR